MHITSIGRGRGRRLIIAAFLLTTAVSVSAQPLTEAEAIERALVQPELGELGAANRAEAEAAVGAIRRFDNPEATLTRESVSGDERSETEWQIGVTQPIDISGRRSSLRAAAQAEVGAVEADTARRRQERIAQVRNAYVSCAASAEKVRIADAFVERLREAERIVNARANAGDAAVYDLRRLRVEARAAEAEAALQQGEANASCASLASLTGSPNARPTASLDLIAMRPTTIMPARPDIVAREQRVSAAEQRVRAAQRGRLPDLNVGVGLKQIEGDEGSTTGPVVSLGMRVPLFDGGGSAVRQAQARLRAEQAELALARREIDATVAAAQARSDAALEAAERAQAAGDDARRLGAIAEAAYQGGEVGIVELVDAFRTARDAEMEIIERLERAVQARVVLELAQGAL
ncbi:MAG: TolC family protein [Allosphingosinicella sp.]|uniref:TolC family protein n=1 Tax=Allosphingosinicella sp. TaxID=2823234 RepID=UPI00395C374D